jgi:hypothetical protein
MAALPFGKNVIACLSSKPLPKVSLHIGNTFNSALLALLVSHYEVLTVSPDHKIPVGMYRARMSFVQVF